MNVLVACEESQAVCTELRKLGHNAFSCDILECSGGHPEWHILGDCVPLLNGHCSFNTMDGTLHSIKGKWDLLICHPPCTYLTVSGNRWFNIEKYGEKAVQRYKDREEAVAFFMTMANADCDRIAIENPIGVMNTGWRKPDQIIQPYMFGDPFEKTTCLWLKGLEPLAATNVVQPPPRQQVKGGKSLPEWYSNAPKKDRARIRSKTFPGIAAAMAQQWTV